MLNQGPVPVVIHGIIEYVAGVFFIIAPLLFGYDSSTATALSVAVGVVILLVAGTTNGPTGFIDKLPLLLHVVMDYLLAVFLIAAPFAFGFADDPQEAPKVIFIALGIVHLLLTIATKFNRPEETIEPAGE